MKAPIALFATPDGMSALKDYMGLFAAERDIHAAQVGFDYHEVILSNSWVKHKLFVRQHDIEGDCKIVAMTVAGMRWNLEAKLEKEASDYRKIWIQGERLKGEADVTK